jgi:redox-sensing transcriptional repressor
MAIENYFSGKRTKLSIVASFDIDPKKIGKKINGIECFHVRDMKKVIKQKNINIGIMTVPAEQAADIAKKLVDAGITGILNYTPKPVNVPDNVYLEEYDMITSLEKVAFFVKTHDAV